VQNSMSLQPGGFFITESLTDYLHLGLLRASTSFKNVFVLTLSAFYASVDVFCNPFVGDINRSFSNTTSEPMYRRSNGSWP